MTRVLLDRIVDRAAIDRAARARGWPLLNLFRRTDARPRQIVFGTGEWLLTFVEDHRIAATYAVVDGHDAEGVAQAVRASLPWMGLDAVTALLDGPDRVKGICWLGVVGPATPEGPVAAILAAAASSEVPAEREAAAFAREALGWPP